MMTNLSKPIAQNFWSEYNIRLEPWSIGYDAPVSINPEEIPASDKVNIEFEVSNDEWQPIRAAICLFCNYFTLPLQAQCGLYLH